MYLHVQLKSGIWKSSLVLSRAKVAPIKRLSLPRLELMGALLRAPLMVYVHQALKLPADVPYHCWTDSTATLDWVQCDPHKWPLWPIGYQKFRKSPIHVGGVTAQVGKTLLTWLPEGSQQGQGN